MELRYNKIYKKNVALFHELKRRGLLEQYIEKLGIKKYCSAQSEERTLKLAQEYTGTNFTKEFPCEYNHAIRHKYISKLKKILNIRVYSKKIIHSEKRTLKIAQEYTGNNFTKDYNNEYCHARNNGYSHKLVEIINNKKIFHSEEKTLKIAQEYTGNSFTTDYPNEYAHARNNGYSHKLNVTLNKRIYPGRIIHSEERTLKIAQEYTGSSFRKDYNKEYTHAIRNNYLPKLRDILHKNKLPSCTEEKTLELARNYIGNNFGKDYSKEYIHAIRNNYLPKLKQILKQAKS